MGLQCIGECCVEKHNTMRCTHAHDTHMHMRMHISEMSHLDAKAGRRLAQHLAEGGGGAGVNDRLQQNART